MPKKLEKMILSHHLVKTLDFETQNRLLKKLDYVSTERLAVYIMFALTNQTGKHPRADLNDNDQIVYDDWQALWAQYVNNGAQIYYEPGFVQALTQIKDSLSDFSTKRLLHLIQEWRRQPYGYLTNPSLRDILIDCFSDGYGNNLENLTDDEKRLLGAIYVDLTESSFRQNLFPPVSRTTQKRADEYQEKDLKYDFETWMLWILAVPNADHQYTVGPEVTTTELLVYELLYLHKMFGAERGEDDVYKEVEGYLLDAIEESHELEPDSLVFDHQHLLSILHLYSDASE